MLVQRTEHFSSATAHVACCWSSQFSTSHTRRMRWCDHLPGNFLVLPGLYSYYCRPFLMETSLFCTWHTATLTAVTWLISLLSVLRKGMDHCLKWFVAYGLPWEIDITLTFRDVFPWWVVTGHFQLELMWLITIMCEVLCDVTHLCWCFLCPLHVYHSSKYLVVTIETLTRRSLHLLCQGVMSGVLFLLTWMCCQFAWQVPVLDFVLLRGHSLSMYFVILLILHALLAHRVWTLSHIGCWSNYSIA
jgi:hypothetical protein